MPQHGIILLGKQLQLLRRQLRLDTGRLRLTQHRRIRHRHRRTRPIHRPRRRPSRNRYITTTTLIQNTLLPLPNPLNPLLHHPPLHTRNPLQPPPQKPKHPLPHTRNRLRPLLSLNLLPRLSLLQRGLVERAAAAGPAPEQRAGGGVPVFLAQERGGGFLAEGFGGGEVCY